MSWTPRPTVFIDDREYTGRTVGNVSITRGRQNVFNDSQPGYASIEIIDTDAEGLGFEINAVVQVTVLDGDDVPVRLFTGFVSDWSSQVVRSGDGVVVRYRLRAVGPLARLARRQVMSGGRGEELDGARVLDAIEQGSLISWEEWIIQSWEDTASDLTWEEFDPGYDPSLIDSGVFDIAALDPEDGGYVASRVIASAAQSAQGVLFETADGFIGYADANRRRANAVAGFLDIPWGLVREGAFSLESSLADVTNRVFVEFDGGIVQEEEEFSIIRFGVQETVLRTELANQANAEARAIDYLFSHIDPRVEVNDVKVNLRSDVPSALRNSLLRVGPNGAVRLTGVPAATGALGFRGFVEGVSYRLNDFEFDVDLFVSDFALSVGAVRYGQVDPTLEYGQVDPTLEYREAREVTS